MNWVKRVSDRDGAVEATLFDDEPIDGESRPDLLGRAAFADHTARPLERVHNRGSSTVLALVGHGYGIFSGILFAAVLTPVALVLWLLYQALRPRR